MATRATTSQQADDAGARRDDAACWRLLRTRSRHERIVARAAAAAGVVTVLPMTTCSRVYGDRTLRVDVPLLPGTVFVHGTAGDVAALSQRGWVTDVVELPDQHQVEQDLKRLAAAAKTAGGTVSLAEDCTDAPPIEVHIDALQGLRPDRATSSGPSGC